MPPTSSGAKAATARPRRRTSTPSPTPPTLRWRSTGWKPARRRWSRSRSSSPGSATICAPATVASARASRSTAKSTTPENWLVDGVARAAAHLVSRDDQGRPAYGGTPSDSAVVQAIRELKARGSGSPLSVHPDGRGAGQRAAGPLQRPRLRHRPAGLSLAWANHLLAGRRLRRQPGQERRRRQSSRHILRRGSAIRLRRRRRACRVGRRSRRLGPAPDDPALRAPLRCGRRGRRLPDRLGLRAITQGEAAPRAIRQSPSSSTSPPTCARSRPGTKLSYDANGRSTSATIRRTARATSSSTSIRSGRTMGSILSASTTTCRSPTGATGSTISTPRVSTRSPTSTTCVRTSRAARATTGSMPAPPTAMPRCGPNHRRRRWPALGLPLQGRPQLVVEPASQPPRRRRGRRDDGWAPESKPIRFTEIGCPAVDRGPNQPNVFYDPKSAESFLPYFSRGWRDDAVQRRFLEAALGYWAEAGTTRSPASMAGG